MKIQKIKALDKSSRKPKSQYGTISFQVLPEQRAMMWAIADAHGCPLSDVLRLAIDEFLEKHFVDRSKEGERK